MPPRSLLSDEQMSSPPPAATPRQLRRRAAGGTVSRLPGAGRGGAGGIRSCVTCVTQFRPRAGGVCTVQAAASPCAAPSRRTNPQSPVCSLRLLPSAPVCSRLLSSVSGARLRISSALPLFIMLLVLAGRTPHIQTSPTSTSMYFNIYTIHQTFNVYIYFYSIENPLKTLS